MYVVVNLERMQFVHKHEDMDVVVNLVFIETPPEEAVSITPFDGEEYFNFLTDMESKMLYRNTTGADYNGPGGFSLRAVLRDLASRIPVSDVNAFDCEIQAAHLEKKRKEGVQYKYVKGANCPAVAGELFTLQPLLTTVSESEAQIIKEARKAAPAPKVQAQAARPDRPVPRERKKSGSVRVEIWNVADSLWEEAARPTDRATVLALRKQMMDVLEQKGIKRTSSSNELGNWQKARIV